MRRSKDNNTLTLGLGIRYNNRSLFADNYLKRHLVTVPEWQSTEGLSEAFSAIKQLYKDKAASLANANEPQTEHNFIRPVLNILWHDQVPGDCYQVQVVIPSLNGHRQPDYALFRTAQDRTNADPLKGTIEYWRDAAAVADAKAWSVSLDRTRGNENPSSQLANYLYRSRVRWGILTNGQDWRLYEREKSSAGGVYFEVSLLDAIQHDDLEAFRYFWAFFRRSAFLPDADGKSFLDKVFQGSVLYATEVGDRLKESVYDALRLIMNGFLDHPANGLDRNNPDDLRQAHDNGLILLYRLLFLLYAEDKKLLPLDNRVYKDHSLKTIHTEINAQLRDGRVYYAGEYGFWPQLLELFGLIDSGLSDKGKVIVPAYNGGLFSAQKFPHIAYLPQGNVTKWQIGAAYLCQAIDMLAYKREKWDEPGTEDIDYNSLDVQHLGSIYEGILELRPEIAAEPLVETVRDGKSVFRPKSEVPSPAKIRGQNPREIDQGEVYLVTDRGERKATGSYYTPKYIVDYIVANTLGPLLDQAAKEVAEMRPEVEREVKKLEQGLADWKAKAAEEPALARQAQDYAKQIDKHYARLLEPYMRLAVLDPAMGSGHFLVGAADFLSMAIATDPNITPPSDLGQEDPQAYYKRLVVERCLYGVDLNPMAVELAKLSLWLHTVSKNKALSFLDHHFRCGNSLIGASADDMSRTPPLLDARGKVVTLEAAYVPIAEVLTANHLQFFLDTFQEIVELPVGTLDGERQKARLYAEMDEARDKFRAVANCWLAPYFGVPIILHHYEQAVSALRNPAEWPMLEQEEWFRQAQEVARERNFFHWELEFPERFFTPRGLKPERERGFDAVIANPPYLRIQILASSDAQAVNFFNERFRAVGGNYDIYALFVECGLRKLLPGGGLGFILPHKFFQADYGAGLRQWLAEERVLRGIVDFGSEQVFEEATTYTCLLFLSGSRREDFTYARPDVPWDIAVNGGPHTVRHDQSELRAGSPWSFADSSISELRKKVERVSLPLAEVASRIFQGLKTSADSIYVLTVQADLGSTIRVHSAQQEKDYTLEKGLLRPLVKGGDCKRYDLRPTDRVILFPYRRDTKGDVSLLSEQELSTDFPLTHAYLLENKASLETRERGKLSHHPYYAYGRTQALAVIGRPKILTPDFAPSASYGYDETGEFYFTGGAAGGYGILIEGELSPLYVLTLLNSRLVDALLRAQSTVFRGGWYSYEARFIRNLPICRVAFDTPKPERQALATHIASLDGEALLTKVARQIEVDPPRTDVVHDVLAYLAQRMMDMHKEKGSESAGFLAWLERQIGRPIDDLTGKTKVKAYHDYDLDTLIGVLKQNSGKLKVNPDTRAVQEEIEREFRASLSKIQPLKERIASTDRLIDQIVYKLYGLTDEEIAIVEGTEA